MIKTFYLLLISKCCACLKKQRLGAMGGFNDKEQANVKKFLGEIWICQSIVHGRKPVWNNFRSGIFSKSRDFGGRKSKNPNFAQLLADDPTCRFFNREPVVINLAGRAIAEAPRPLCKIGDLKFFSERFLPMLYRLADPGFPQKKTFHYWPAPYR